MQAVESDASLDDAEKDREAAPTEAYASNDDWARALRNYVKQDNLKAHANAARDVFVLNQPNFRVFIQGPRVVAVSAEVEWDDAPSALTTTQPDRWAFSYRFQALVGDQGTLTAAAAPTVAAEESRVLLDHRNQIVEEYENLEAGVEQRFQILSGPSGNLILRGRLHGPQIDVRMDGEQVVISKQGSDLLRMEAPVVTDAAGRKLPAAFALGSGGLLDIKIQDVQSYPVFVDPVWSATGQGAFAHFGTSVSGGFDINGDGYDDVLVGAPGHDAFYTNVGKVYLFAGSPTGLGATAAWSLAGSSAYSEFGSRVASLDDLDGDGYPDFGVGAPKANVTQGFTTYSEAGQVFLFRGKSKFSFISNNPDWILYGPAQHEAHFGDALAGCRMDADNRADLIVGAPDMDHRLATYPFTVIPDAGLVSFYRGTANGPAAWWSSGEDKKENARLGASIACAGDLYGSGAQHPTVGAPDYEVSSTHRGKIRVYCIDKRTGNPFACWSQDGHDGPRKFGYSLAGGGDVNGDGFDDLLVSSPSNTPALGGKARLFAGSASGPQLLWTIQQPTGTLDKFGDSMDILGDLNGDGFDDFAIGAPFHGGNLGAMQGRVDIFLGAQNGPGSNSDWSAEGSVSGGMFGFSLSRAGDINGDFTDLLVGQPGTIITDPGADGSEGMVFVFLGADAPGGICHPDGTSCENGEYCTVDDSCLNGICVGGGSRDCSSLNDQCIEGICDDSQDACVVSLLTGYCEDGEYCTVGEYCKYGECVNGQPRDCSHLDDECNEGLCDEDEDRCEPQLIAGTCDDGSPCTENDTCVSGTCIGTVKVGDIDCDPDNDGILNDSDGDGTHGDEPPCTGGNTMNCADNCPYHHNPDQADGDADGVGDACDACPGVPNPRPTCVFSLEAVDPANHSYPCKFAGGHCRFDRSTMQGYCAGQEDSDRDGIPDACDLCPNDYDPSNSDLVGAGGDACHDTDGDGLSDLEEIRSGFYGYTSNPFLADTDGDGISDYDEVTGWSDPVSGLVYITDPSDPDTDGDGCPDPYDIPSSSMCDPEPSKNGSSRAPDDALPAPPRLWAVKIDDLSFVWESNVDNFATVGGLDATLSQSEMIIGPIDLALGSSGCMTTDPYDQPIQSGHASRFECSKDVYEDECVADCTWLDSAHPVVLPDMHCNGTLSADGQFWALGLGMGPVYVSPDQQEHYRIRYKSESGCPDEPAEFAERLLYEYFGAGALENPEMPMAQIPSPYHLAYAVPVNLLRRGEVIEDHGFMFTETNAEGDTWVMGSVTLTPIVAEISDTPCDWLPVGGDESDDDSNDLTYQVRLLPEAVGGQTLQAKLRVEVTERTSYKGYAMNASYNDGTDEDPDLVCPSSTLTGWTCEEGETPEGQAALVFETTDVVQGGQALELKVKSRDYAAYGKIAAYVDSYVGPGMESVGPGLRSRGWIEDRPRKEGWTTIPIDRGDNGAIKGNKIADIGWEATGKLGMTSWIDDGYDRGVDDDTSPVGDGTQGDGLIALNEYRGFMVQDEHLRTNPELKDIFVLITIDGSVGITEDELLGYARNIVDAPIHRILDSERHYTYHTINFNKTEFEGEKDQCGTKVVVYEGTIPDLEDPVYGVTLPLAGQPDEPCIPCNVKFCQVSQAWIEQDFLAEFGPSAVYRIILSTVAHELGHGMRIPHWDAVLSLEEGGPWSVMISLGLLGGYEPIRQRFANETPDDYDIVMDMPHFLLYE